jgi:hypothetical protein
MGTLRRGKGTYHPGHNDAVRAYATCWGTDGAKVYVTPYLQTFPMNDVQPGLAEVLHRVVEGEVLRLRIPRTVLDPGGAAQDLIVALEVAEIVKAPSPPADSLSPPARQTRTDPPIPFKLLQRGSGGRTPKAGQYAVVDYAVWKPEGDLVDTSFWSDGSPWLAMKDMAGPWADAVRGMHVGDRVRFWAPRGLASPTGKRIDGSPVVVDMELVAIVSR